MPTIQQLIHQADEAHAQRLDFEREAKEPVSLTFLIQQIPAWKRFYLKRNQQRNYFRVTRIVPPGMEELPFFWSQKFQVWLRGKLDHEYPIDAATFDFWAMQPGWEKEEHNGMPCAILRPQPPAPTAQPGNDY